MYLCTICISVANCWYAGLVSDIAIFVLKRDVKLQPTNLLCRAGVVSVSDNTTAYVTQTSILTTPRKYDGFSNGTMSRNVICNILRFRQVLLKMLQFLFSFLISIWYVKVFVTWFFIHALWFFVFLLLMCDVISAILTFRQKWNWSVPCADNSSWLVGSQNTVSCYIFCDNAPLLLFESGV